MSQIRLRHLTFVGPERPPASVDFGEALTVIYGASDTGKSYIGEAVDFVLGRSKLRQIDEAEGYTHVLLGVQLPDQSSVTLVRTTNGTGRVRVYFSDLRSMPQVDADLTLARQHSAKDDLNISRFLINQIGLGSVAIRTNKKNVTRPLSFRDVAPLCIVDETSMQSQRSPVLPSEQYTKETAEKSVFRVLLDGDDDSDLEETVDNSEQRKIGRGKLDVIEDIIANLRGQQQEAGQSRSQIEGRLYQLNESMNDQLQRVGAIVELRDGALERREAATDRGVTLRLRLAEVHDLVGRFNLLLNQYNSDLSRLDMVEEAGNLLGFFSAGPCAFCGAEPEDQRFHEHVDAETTMLSEAVSSERQKTLLLRDDLAATIQDLQVQSGSIAGDLRTVEASLAVIDAELATLDASLRPAREAMSEALDLRSRLEREVLILEQIERLEHLREGVEQPEDLGQEDVAAYNFPSDRSLAEFSRVIAQMLSKWEIPNSDSVHFDKDAADLVIGRQPRSSRGKGMRAITHAAFTVGLAEYCADRDLPHPGFTILDSPLVTFRAPEGESAVAPASDEYVDEEVSIRFYRHVKDSVSAQVIVIENEDLPVQFGDSVVRHRFTKNPVSGRYGFFPPR